ncbi:MAG: TraR/DksA C4-type zinc finger protein [Patescibacteria group bacterium]|jgi:RNA polymerase-binding transcription factor DksA
MKIDEKFLAKQKKRLKTEKIKLEKKITELEKYPDYGRGEDDNAREFEDFETNLSVDTQLKLLLKKINIALSSIEKSTYGRCTICKQEIENGRLKLMPYAAICVTCEKKTKK